jgi:DNA polymerase-3 subunit delta'
MIYPWQKTQWQQLLQQREQNRLPHAVLLYGDAGLGKAEFAHELAASLFCRENTASGAACGVCSACRLLAAETHPDLVVLRPEAAKNSTSKKPVLMIRIDTIRALCARMAMTSQFEGGYRIVILENADRMNIEAANALLKTLEEPGGNSLLILTSSHPSRLPVTVVSRCQGLRFPRPDKGSVLPWLEAQGVTQAELKLRLVHGAPMLALAQDTAIAEARKQLSEALLANMKQTTLSHANTLAKLPNQQLLSWMLDWVSDLVRLRQLSATEAQLVNEDQRTALNAYASQLNSQRLFELYDQITGYLRAESIALNAELLWENLLLSWQGLKQ